MDKNRRNLLKASASAAVGSVLMGTQGMASAQAASGAQVGAVAPLAGKVGMRLATCVLAPGAAPTVGGGAGRWQGHRPEGGRASPERQAGLRPELDAGPDQERQRGLRATEGGGRPRRTTEIGLAGARQGASCCRLSPSPTATSTALAGTTSITSRKARRARLDTVVENCRTIRSSSRRRPTP